MFRLSTTRNTAEALFDQQEVGTNRRMLRTPEENRSLAAYEALEGDVHIVQSGQDDHIWREVILSYQAALKTVNSLTHRIMPCASDPMRDPLTSASISPRF